MYGLLKTLIKPDLIIIKKDKIYGWKFKEK